MIYSLQIYTMALRLNSTPHVGGSQTSIYITNNAHTQ